MKIVYTAEKEELQVLIKESIHEEIEAFLKGLNQKTIPERISLLETAQYLGVSKQTMYGYTSSRKIPFHKFGKRIFFYTQELDDWLKNNAPRYKSREEISREADEYLMNAARKKLNRR
jgi:excisionase family DNA binding protein